MPLAKISQLAGTGIHVPGDDIDTDRIIPARFMKCVTFDGLGEFAFYDERFDAEAKPKPHPMNDPKYVVLVMLDEPKGNRSTYGFASGGWTAAPTMARITTGVSALPPNM